MWEGPTGALAQRKVVLKELEKARQDKIIGKPEEARIVCNYSGEEWWPEMQSQDFAELCIVSQCQYTFGGGKDFSVIVEKSPLPACRRCYLRVPSVEDTSRSLCRRCRNVLGDTASYASSGEEQ